MTTDKPAPTRVADVFRLMAQASESDMREPLAVLTKQLTDAMYEKAREQIPYGEHLDVCLVRGLVRELYDYSFTTEDTATGHNMRITAAPKDNKRLIVDPEKVVAIKDGDGETVGVLVSDGAFKIVEFA